MTIVKFLVGFNKNLGKGAIALATALALGGCGATTVTYSAGEPCGEVAFGHPDGSGVCAPATQIEADGWVYQNGVWSKP